MGFMRRQGRWGEGGVGEGQAAAKAAEIVFATACVLFFPACRAIIHSAYIARDERMSVSRTDGRRTTVPEMCILYTEIWEDCFFMEQMNKGDILAVGLMMFSIFFGAGNLIFQPALEQAAVNHANIEI